MYKILIAEPIYHAMRPDVYFNRIAFWSETVKCFCDIRSMVIGPRNGIRVARDRAINAAIEHNATHLFFMDDDILVPPDILTKLLAVDRPIVGGLIHRDNGDPLVWKAVNISEIGIDYHGEEVWHNHPKQGAFECAAIAAGCMLIQVHVLKHLRMRQGDRRWIFNYDETERSMDVRFCRLAARNGFSSFCWPDIPCVQVKDY